MTANEPKIYKVTNKRVMQALWRRGVKDEVSMRDIPLRLGCEPLADSYFRKVMRRLRKPDSSADSPSRTVRKDIEEVLAYIDGLLDDLGVPDKR